MNTTLLQSRDVHLNVRAQPEEESHNQPFMNDWIMDMNAQEEDAVDEILSYLIQNAVRPSITLTGDIIDIVTGITTTMNKSVPSHLENPLKIMMDYTARWLCQYVEQTSTTRLKVTFGFDGSSPSEEQAGQ